MPPVSSSSGLIDIVPGPALGVPVEGRESSSFEMLPGELMVLYTDGLVEDRSVPLQQRLEKLAREVTGGPRQPLELLMHLESAMLGGQVHDDTATIAIQRLAR
jgi:serine phosphatase RsbU (regulator of sigma subunit)